MREHSGAIVAERSASGSDPLGSGSNGLKYWRRDILDSHLVTAADLSSTSHRALTVHTTCSHFRSKYRNEKKF